MSFIKRQAVIGSLLFAVCAVVETTAQAPAPAAKPVDQRTIEEPVSALAVPTNFRYNALGRRDPFVNPVPKPVRAESDIPKDRPRGLKGVLLSEAQINGIVWSKDADMIRVVLAAPGGKTYFAHKGDYLFDASIKEIQREGVVFVTQSKNPDGKIMTREVVRKVRPTP